MPIAHYTQRHMDNLRDKGHTVEHISLYAGNSRRAEDRARSRIINAANRLGIKVSTRIEWGEHGLQAVGTVREEQHDVA
jgi:hypothetical protein